MRAYPHLPTPSLGRSLSTYCVPGTEAWGSVTCPRSQPVMESRGEPRCLSLGPMSGPRLLWLLPCFLLGEALGLYLRKPAKAGLLLFWLTAGVQRHRSVWLPVAGRDYWPRGEMSEFSPGHSPESHRSLTDAACGSDAGLCHLPRCLSWARVPTAQEPCLDAPAYRPGPPAPWGLPVATLLPAGAPAQPGHNGLLLFSRLGFGQTRPARPPGSLHPPL